MPKEKGHKQASATFLIANPRIEVRLSSSTDQIDLSIYSADHIDTCMATEVDESEANELIDKLWLAIDDLKKRKISATWQRLIKRET